MKKIILLSSIALFFLALTPESESFVVAKQPKKTKTSKRELLQECAESAIETARQAADLLEEVAELQRNIARIQRSAIDTAVSIVSDECRAQSADEIVAMKNHVHAQLHAVKKTRSLMKEAQRSLSA